MSGNFKAKIKTSRMGRYVRVGFGPRGGLFMQSSNNKKFRGPSVRRHRSHKYEVLALSAMFSVGYVPDLPTAAEDAA